MTTFKLGKLSIDAVGYGISGNAVLGIKDSGKTYTATFIAEHLFDAGIPFVAFDPIGVWRFLQVPGTGKGYPVVVAGGEHPDLPLTVNGAPEIVRAAMRNGVSLVIDLFSVQLSKADWRRIVTSCVKVLLHENKQHGLRHIFLEEAAEFVPQKVMDGDVYAAVEKLARMGGNSRLGYTLINPRSQEVNKAVLELCENVFLHRQRGKNALENMDKWLGIAGAHSKEIMQSLPDLPQGKCWAWIGGDNPMPPELIKVPHKNSMHPDRRVMRGDEGPALRKAVDVGSFVQGMRSSLVSVEAEAKANDPVELRRTITGLEAKIRKLETPGKSAPSVDRAALEAEFNRGYAKAEKVAAHDVGFLAGKVIAALQAAERHAAALEQWIDEARVQPTATQPAPRPAPAPPSRQAAMPIYTPAAEGLTGPQQRMLDVIAFWNSVGYSNPTREQVAGVCGYSIKASTFRVVAGALKTAGYIEYPSSGKIALTPSGHAIAQALSTAETKKKLESIMTGAQIKVVNILRQHGGTLHRGVLIDEAGYSQNASTHRVVIGGLRTLEIVQYPERGRVELSKWASEVLSQ